MPAQQVFGKNRNIFFRKRGGGGGGQGPFGNFSGNPYVLVDTGFPNMAVSKCEPVRLAGTFISAIFLRCAIKMVLDDTKCLLLGGTW